MLFQKKMRVVAITSSSLIVLVVLFWLGYKYHQNHQKSLRDAASETNAIATPLFVKQSVDIRKSFEGVVEAYESLQMQPCYVVFSVPENEFKEIQELIQTFPGIAEVQALNSSAMVEEGFLECIHDLQKSKPGMVEMRVVLTNKSEVFQPGQVVNVSLVLQSF